MSPNQIEETFNNYKIKGAKINEELKGTQKLR